MPPYSPSGIRFAAFFGQLQFAGARKVQLRSLRGPHAPNRPRPHLPPPPFFRQFQAISGAP